MSGLTNFRSSTRPSRSEHLFSQVPQATIPRSSFNRTHGHKTTFDAGFLVPVYVDEVLPGDTFSLKMTAFVRMATLLFPLMDNLYLDSFFFFVPNRLLWTNWERFNGAQDNPSDTTDYTVPEVKFAGGNSVANGSLFDYMGLPTGINGIVFNALHARAYNLIYNEWFRDENLQVSVAKNMGDGPDSPSDYVMLRRGKRHDYFTSCLPWPQKVNDGTEITLPLGTSASVKYVPYTTSTNQNLVRRASDDTLFTADSDVTDNFLGTPASAGDGTGKLLWTEQRSAHADRVENAFLDPNGRLYADLSTATAATINQLRQAFQLQRLYERDARGGTRYTEIIRSHFGVTSPDARLQRPEYLGGGSTPINIHAVPQTSSTSGSNYLANLSAYGTAVANNHGFTKSFTEHGVLIGIVSVRADLNYQKGLHRMWSRQIRWDFYWPGLSHIGEQVVFNKEIYYQNTSDDAKAFGYQERYAEYRYGQSKITGQFRSSFSTPLDAWHLAENFTSLPVLGDTFISTIPPMARIKAAGTNAPDFLFDSTFELKCARPMPVYGVPGFIDHF